MWDVENGQRIYSLEPDTGGTMFDAANSIAFSPSGMVLAAGYNDKSIRLWDLSALELVSRLEGHDESVKSVAFSPDGQLLASGSADHTIRLWDIANRECIGVLDGHDGSVVFVIRSDGKEVYRSQTIHDHRTHEAKIDVSGVDILELVVENSGDGNANDWGLWLAPTLER